MNDVFIRARLVIATALLGAACSTKAIDSQSEATGGAGSPRDLAVESDWCAARRVLEAKCWRCHGAPPDHGAPFPLVTYDDTQIVSGKGTPRFVVIEAAVSDDFMPARFIALEPPVAPLTDSEKAALLSWCDSGAPGAADLSCAAEP